MQHHAQTARTNDEDAMPRGWASGAKRANELDGEPSDGEIIAAVRSGDVGAFESLVRRYRRQLIRTAYARLGDASSAEDAVQEAFLSAFRSLATYDSRFSFRSWLWSILINQCRSEYRKRKCRNESADDLDRLPCQQADAAPDQRLIRNDQHERLVNLLEELPAEQADAIQLRFFGEMKFDEIAVALSCSATTAKNRVRMGLERISRKMKNSGLSD